MPNTVTIYESPSPKRQKLYDSQQDENEDLSFLNDIDIDEIVDCLKKCAETDASKCETSNKRNSITIKSQKLREERNSSTSTLKEHGFSTPCSGQSLISENDECESPPRTNDKELLYMLGKQMYNLYNEHFVASIIHYGKFSTIIKCKDTASNNYAIKILRNEEQKFLGKAKQEMLLEMQMNIPKENLFTVYFIEGFSLQKRWCFMMEYYPKTLNQAMQESSKPFHINKVRELARQLVGAITMLKFNDIVHSDIKPSHILLDSSNENLRLCGFDAAHYIGAVKSSSSQGTLHYRAPEIILGYSSGYSIDVWASAIVLLEMATSLFIFPGYSKNEILYRQMCTLGTIPNEMLAKSKYKSQYFDGNMFKRIIGSSTKLIKHKFYPTDRLAKKVMDIQTYHWLDKYEELQKRKCLKERKSFLKKVHSFNELIRQMVVIVPEDRCSIDDVYSDPFIYEMFD